MDDDDDELVALRAMRKAKLGDAGTTRVCPLQPQFPETTFSLLCSNHVNWLFTG